MSQPTVTVKDKKYAVDRVCVVLQMNSGPLLHLGLYEKLDGADSESANEETLKREFLEHIYEEAEGSFEWNGSTLTFLLVGCDNTGSTMLNLVGLVIKRDIADWLNKNPFEDKSQAQLVYQKGSGNSWPFFNDVIGNRCEQPNQDFVDRVERLFPEYGCIWRDKTASNFHFLNQSITFANRYLSELQGWCAVDADKPVRLVLFEEQKQDGSIPKLDQTWLPSYRFLPSRYVANPQLGSACTLSRELDITTGQEIVLIEQLVTDGDNGEDAQKGKNFQTQNPTRLLFSPGTVRVGERNMLCHRVMYEFKLPAFGEKAAPSATVTVALDYPVQQTDGNETESLRLFGTFKAWQNKKEEETTVKVEPLDPGKWAIVDENTQSLKSGSDAVLYAQVLSPSYSNSQYSGIYVKHEKGDEMVVDIRACGVPLAIGSVQKYRKELEAADIALCAEKLALSISSHSQSLTSAEAIVLDSSEIRLNHGKKIFGQAQQTIDFLSNAVEIGSSQVAINSGKTDINSALSVSLPSPKTPAPIVVPVQLFLKDLNGKTKTFNNATPTTKISELKEHLGYVGAGAKGIRLIYAGKSLDMEATIADYPNIGKESTIHVVGSLLGGATTSQELTPEERVRQRKAPEVISKLRTGNAEERDWAISRLNPGDRKGKKAKERINMFSKLNPEEGQKIKERIQELSSVISRMEAHLEANTMMGKGTNDKVSEERKQKKDEAKRELNKVIDKFEQAIKKAVAVYPAEVFKEDLESFLKINKFHPPGSSVVPSADYMVNGEEPHNISHFYIKKVANNQYALEPVSESRVKEFKPEELIKAAYCPYKGGKMSEDFSNVGKILINREVDLVFTPGMNGCALAITSSKKGLYAWHLQNPDDDDIKNFRKRQDFCDVYTYKDYNTGDEAYQEKNPFEEACIILARERETSGERETGVDSWYVLSQQLRAPPPHEKRNEGMPEYKIHPEHPYRKKLMSTLRRRRRRTVCLDGVEVQTDSVRRPTLRRRRRRTV